MRYVSTRGRATDVDFVGAMVAGLAPDGGLYMPESIPTLPTDWTTWSYQDAVSNVLELYGAYDTELIVKEAASQFRHPEVAPIVEVGDRLVLELFWGPTLSFKDHAMQVVARLLDREVEDGLILGATSGDTGSAAIEACRGREGLMVVILFPEGRVSDFQRRQMTTVTERNTRAVAVRGTFDDCQRMVKEAFAAYPNLLAVNSINWARVAAQVGYHVATGARMGEPYDVVVPTGNFGNVYSCWLAKQMGVPIETITIANNANHGLSDLVNTGELHAVEVVPTTAPAMDIQVPSNLERFQGDPTEEFRAGWSSDIQIAETIADVEREHGYRLDPHTATAWRAGDETRGDRPQLILATAHPSKFDDAIAPPDWFPSLDGLAEQVITIDPDLAELEHQISV
ncbi:MAG TPA: threonine synthase [Acidimicrobiia bacterium]|nr:threonine synthase [Acidimicrobiia bacterium]